MRLQATSAIAFVVLLGLPQAGRTQPSQPALLNEVELARLVERAAPADHARLAAHFTALEEAYRGEAARHASMARQLSAFASRQPALPGHCERLAAANTRMADAARELAAYHTRLGQGATPAAAPPDAEGLEAGAGARPPTGQELAALVSSAATPEDHRQLSGYFAKRAERYSAAADRHAAIARSYRNTKLAPAAAHCDRLAKAAREASGQARAAADAHAALAAAR